MYICPSRCTWGPRNWHPSRLRASVSPAKGLIVASGSVYIKKYIEDIIQATRRASCIFYIHATYIGKICGMFTAGISSVVFCACRNPRKEVYVECHGNRFPWGLWRKPSRKSSRTLLMRGKKHEIASCGDFVTPGAVFAVYPSAVLQWHALRLLHVICFFYRI